jgi:2-amino-4-hydroxy-6-hydroxymethyldihydropteridine diphosphokinase
LRELGTVERRSQLYRSKPWGYEDQPDFVNAVAALATALEPLQLLHALQAIEGRLGRRPGVRWGPRVVDLDVLTFGNLRLDGELRVPHDRMHQRAFVLIPLAEIDPAFAALRDALAPLELASVAPLAATGRPRVSPAAGGSLSPMSRDAHAADRIRRLAEFLAASDVLSLSIERDDEFIELGRSIRKAPQSAPAVPAARVDTIRADLVGIFRLARPAPVAGENLGYDRELAHIEALGIRNPVHSLGGGRIVSIAAVDGSPVEYGQPLFLLDRG